MDGSAPPAVTASGLPRGLVAVRWTCYGLRRDIAGDAFFLAAVYANRRKDWVNRMFIPYCVFFSLGAAASLLSVTVKVLLIVSKLCHRIRSESGRQATEAKRASLGGMVLSPKASMALGSKLHRTKSIQLKAKFEQRKLVRASRFVRFPTEPCEPYCVPCDGRQESRRHMCLLLLAVFGAPFESLLLSSRLAPTYRVPAALARSVWVASHRTRWRTCPWAS
jgi:hypothetical protein